MASGLEQPNLNLIVIKMSTIKVNQIKSKLRAMFEEHLDLGDIKKTDPERDQKILTRCLAALAVFHCSACTTEEAAKAVWDGADDNGIDAAYFDVAEKRLIFVQSKFINKGSGEPEAADIGTFVKGVRDIVEQETGDFHQRLQVRLNEALQYMNTPGTSVHVVVVTTGSSKLAKHGSNRINKLLSELNGDDPEPIASSEVLGLSEVYADLASDHLQSVVSLDAQIFEWSAVTSPYRGFFGIVDGLQLKQWWRTYGKRIVAGNIRHSLGSTDVNQKIRSTAINTPELFWYFNNGITLVADDAVKAPGGAAARSAGVFQFKGASIVNGAQTISTLGRIDEDVALGKVRVPFRVILSDGAPAGFSNEVTKANNLQNRVEPRDFVAQDPEQARLRREMIIENVDYQYVRSEEAIPSPDSCDLIEVTTALACASRDPNLAVQVKTGVSRFYSDLTKPPYKAIFNPSTTGAYAFNTVLVLREIEQWIENTKRGITKKTGQSWGTLVHGNRILAAIVFFQLKQTLLDQPIIDFRKNLSKLKIPQLCTTAHNNMTSAVTTHYPQKFLAVLFKNPTMSKHVFDLSK